MTQTKRPTLVAAPQDGVDATRGSSILSALEQTSARKPVLYADRPSVPRRLPWHWPLMALGLAGAALWGYASWSSRAAAVDAGAATPVLPQVSDSSNAQLLTTSKTRTSGSIVATNGTGADAVIPAVPVETKADTRADTRADTKADTKADTRAAVGAAGTPATLVDIAAAARDEPTPSSRAAAPTRKAMPEVARGKTATPKAVTAKAPAAAVKPVSPPRPVQATPAEDDHDVAVVSALIGPARERGVDAAAPAMQTRPTIASLIRQCHALAPREADVCRRQICDGYWGKAQACPAAAADRRTARH